MINLNNSLNPDLMGTDPTLYTDNNSIKLDGKGISIYFRPGDLVQFFKDEECEVGCDRPLSRTNCIYGLGNDIMPIRLFTPFMLAITVDEEYRDEYSLESGEVRLQLEINKIFEVASADIGKITDHKSYMESDSKYMFLLSVISPYLRNKLGNKLGINDKMINMLLDDVFGTHYSNSLLWNYSYHYGYKIEYDRFANHSEFQKNLDDSKSMMVLAPNASLVKEADEIIHAWGIPNRT